MAKSRPITRRMRVEYLSVRLLTRIMEALGLARRHTIARLLGLLWYYLIPFRKKVVLANLSAAFPDRTAAWRRRIARRNLQQICSWYCDLVPFYKYSQADFDRWVEVDQADCLRHTLNEGRGCLVVAYHFGNWEILGDWLGRSGYKAGAVATRQQNKLIDRWLTALRQRHGLQLFPKSRRNTWKLKRFLNEGGTLLLIADQDARRSGLFVDFLGRPASTHRGPALFALYGKTPILTASCLWTGKGYRLTLKAFAFEPDAPSFEANVQALTQQLAAYYASLIRQFPEHYYWVHRRWKTQPPTL